MIKETCPAGHHSESYLNGMICTDCLTDETFKHARERKLKANSLVAMVFALFFALMLFVSHAQAMGSRKPDPKPVPAPVEVPRSGSRIEISAKITGSVEHVARIQKILKVIEKMVNSEKWAKRVSGSTYKNYAAKGPDVLVKMSEPWDLDLEVARHCEKTVCDNLGWTFSNSKKIYFNDRGYRKTDKSKFDTRNDAGIAGTICHEWSHKKGYGHLSASSSMSVPYSMGTICAELYQEFYDSAKEESTKPTQSTQVNGWRRSYGPHARNESYLPLQFKWIHGGPDILALS